MKVFGFITFSILNIVSAFNWLTPVVNLLEKVSNAVTETFGAVGVFGIACAIALMVFLTHWLKNTTYRIGYHLGMALTLMLIGVFMVSPVRFAAQAVSLGGAGATEIGQKATGADQSATISQILATKYLREPMFRANYGANLDQIPIGNGRTCGDVFDDAVKADVPADKIKDSVKGCGPGIGKKLHDYAMNPDNLNYDLMIGLGTIALLGVFVIIVACRVMQSGVATVLHAAAVKPSLLTVMAGPAAQVLALRNIIAIPLGALAVAADLLVLVLGAAFTGFIAVATGSSAIAGLITSLAMIGLILGTWRFSRNLRANGAALSEQLARAKLPSTGALTAQQARQGVARVVTRTTSLAATLSGNPAAAAALSALGPGVRGAPRSNALIHQRGAYSGDNYPAVTPATTPTAHGPAAGTPARYQAHPVAAASQVAYQIQYKQPAVPAPTALPAAQYPRPARPTDFTDAHRPVGRLASPQAAILSLPSAVQLQAQPQTTTSAANRPPRHQPVPNQAAPKPERHDKPVSIPMLNPDSAQQAHNAAAKHQPPGPTP